MTYSVNGLRDREYDKFSVVQAGSLTAVNVIVASGTPGVNIVTDTPTVGDNYKIEYKYLISGTATGLTGSQIGSIIKHFATGSYVKVLTYTTNQVETIGSWS